MDQLKRLRVEKELSQARLAARAGLDPSTVNQIERGAREASPVTLRKLAEALDVSIAELLESDSPKAERRSSPEPRLFNGDQDERPGDDRDLRYLRAWRAYVYKLARRWENEPPATAGEISVVLDTMEVLMHEGAWKRPDAEITTADSREVSEWLELSLLYRGLAKLNQIADKVQADEEAEIRRSQFRMLQERSSEKSA